MSTPTFTLQDDPVPQSRSRRPGRRATGGSRGVTSSDGRARNTHVVGIDGSANLHRHFQQHSKEKDADPTDGNGSLTYSASSSINSHSTAGESTDSSFSGIMKVLELDDDAELDYLVAKGDSGALTLQQQQILIQHSQREQQQQRERREMHNSLNGHRHQRSDHSIASDSLQYSAEFTDDAGFPLPQTVTGQTSDSHAHDGGGHGANEQGALFTPALPQKNNTINTKSRPTRKKITSISPPPSHHQPRPTNRIRSRSEPNLSRTSSSSSSRSGPTIERTSSSTRIRTRTLDALAANNSSPPPRGAVRDLHDVRPQQLWYKQWWMCGFTDALNFEEP